MGELDLNAKTSPSHLKDSVRLWSRLCGGQFVLPELLINNWSRVNSCIVIGIREEKNQLMEEQGHTFIQVVRSLNLNLIN